MKKRLIWYIDRDEQISNVVRNEFPKLNQDCELAVFTSPLTLDEHLQERLPELIFIDKGIALQDDASLVRDLKGNDATEHIVVVLLSSDIRIEEEAQEIGADDFLKKPFDMHQLLEKATETLDKK